ncbi:MAG: hypothetical protein Q9M44_02765 [Ghiorsea sp.]|nr:hypothetical protein [Ghiorsea sp.]
MIKHDISESLTAIRIAAQLMCRQSEGRQTYPVAKSIVLMVEQVAEQMSKSKQVLQNVPELDLVASSLAMVIHGDETRLTPILKNKLMQVAQVVYQNEEISDGVYAELKVAKHLATVVLSRGDDSFFSYTIDLDK